MPEFPITVVGLAGDHVPVVGLAGDHVPVVGLAGDHEAVVGLAGDQRAAHIGAADLLVGGRRHLEGLPGRHLVIAGDIAPVLDGIAAEPGRVCVLASGDPGFFGIVRALAERFGPGALDVRPAAPSVSLAFARLGLPWDDAVVVSAHGRPLRAAARATAASAKAAVLTSPDSPPEALGKELLVLGATHRRVVVCTRLGLPEESVSDIDLATLAAGTWDPLSVVILLDGREVAPRPSLAWGLPEHRFAHRDGMITKSEVRAVAVAKLCLPAAGVLWDVGAGSGSVAVECAGMSPGLRVIAIERDAAQAERTRANATEHGVDIEVIEASAPAALHGLPTPDRAFVGGGGLDVLDAVTARLAPGGRVVATFASLDRAAGAASRLGHLVQLGVSRAAVLPDGGVRLAAENPVFVAVGAGRMTILAVSVTEAGRTLAGRLPYEHLHGRAGQVIPSRWADADGFVLFLAAGAAVRIVAPLLRDKITDPAVVCVDEAGQFAIALCGGHAGGANALARAVATTIGATAVITTASDAAGIPALDQLPGYVAGGDIAGVTAAMLDGRAPTVDVELAWPPPSQLPASGAGPERIVLTDREQAAVSGLVALHPPSLVAGVGASTGAPPDAIGPLLDAALAGAGLARASLAEVATIDRRAGDEAVLALGLPVRSFTAEDLATVTVPSPSEVVRAAVGTPSVAEAAALLAAGPGAELVVTKQVAAQGTVAIARRRGPKGHLAVVGLGPGGLAHRTPAAAAAVRRAEIVIGYGPYIDACADLLTTGHEVVRSPIGDETVRAKQAVAEAEAGRRVALVCSGDAGVYAMASLALEVAGDSPLDVEVVPGVTAALAASALVGAPLGHDHVMISLSDLLTPWSAIETRLRAAAAADLVVALYNPRSRGRTWQFDAARTILLEHRSASTPVGVITDATRPSQAVTVTTLAEVDPTTIGMTTCVIIGSSTTRVAGGRMVTPRGVLGMTAPITITATAVAIDTRCTGCGACLTTCPERALVAAPRHPLVILDRCTTCMACIEVCPAGAISVIAR